MRWLDFARSTTMMSTPSCLDVDTFLLVGAALGIVDMVAELEQELARSIVSTNIATYWYALRRHGITDPLAGFGQLAQISVIID